MIYTLTLNPAVDYIIKADSLKPNRVNRIPDGKIRFGGKGINVSLVLKEFGVKSTALGFVGGFTGNALEEYLINEGVACDFVKIEGNTRINVKINGTDINAQGPEVSPQNVKSLYEKIETLTKDDVLVMSGNLPHGVSKNIYTDIAKRLNGRGVKFTVDAENGLLTKTLEYNPLFIKPNQHELGEIFGTEINDFKTALFYAEKLREAGALNVMVTLGEAGAVLLDERGESYTAAAPVGDVISAVGSGDSAVAAFLSAYLNGENSAEILRRAVAAGSATAFSYGLAKSDLIRHVYNKTEVL